MDKNPQKFCFISCVNDESQYQKCLEHIQNIEIPTGFSIEIKKVVGAASMAGGYQQAMAESDAKYKVYLHQDTFLRNRRILFEILELFKDSSIGMLGVVGATRLPKSGVWFHNGLESFGRVWEYRTGGGLKYLLGPFNRRKERLMTFRRVPKPYLPVVVIDGLIMVTQYDINWRTDLPMGFIYYEGPQCCEFIKRGYKVVLPKQNEVWCMHYGPPEGAEKTTAEVKSYNEKFRENMEIFKAEYPNFISTHITDLLAKFSDRGEIL